jgi:hypothetical protein
MSADDIARGENLSRSGKYTPTAESNGQTEHIPMPDEPPDDDPYRDQRRDDQRRDHPRRDDKQADTDEPIWTFIDGATFILDQPTTIPALWGDSTEVLWAEGESLMIAGPMGLGKTTLAVMLMCAQLGIGNSSVLGMPVAQRSGKILYLAMDRPAQIARAMLRRFTEDDRAVLAERLLVWRGPPPADIARNPMLLNTLAEAADADTVYLDSVKDAAIGLSDDEVGAGYNRARQHLLAHNVQLAEQHHTVKRGAGGGPPTNVADIYGSAWIANGTGSIIMLSGDPGDPIVGFRHVRAPADEVGPWRLLHDQTAGALSIEHAADLVALVKAKGPMGLTARWAAVTIFENPTPSRSDIEKARRRLDALVADRVLVRREGASGGQDGGTATAWFIAENRSRSDHEK